MSDALQRIQRRKVPARSTSLLPTNSEAIVPTEQPEEIAKPTATATPVVSDLGGVESEMVQATPITPVQPVAINPATEPPEIIVTSIRLQKMTYQKLKQLGSQSNASYGAIVEATIEALSQPENIELLQAILEDAKTRSKSRLESGEIKKVHTLKSKLGV